MKRLKKLLLLSIVFAFVFSFNVFAESPSLDLVGKSAVSFDMETGEIIYTKNIDEKVYPASITKLMTAILLAENTSKHDMLEYTKIAYDQPPYSYGKNIQAVPLGDEMKAEDVMDALLLYSGNDIAYMVADNVADNVPEFVDMMNKKAQELGLKSTKFVNPNGLDDNTAEHLTTAYDLIKLTKVAYENEWVRESMAKQTSTVRTSNTIPSEISNRNKNLGKNGCIGGKTGYTDKAGRCLTSVYERNGRKIIGIVMNSELDTDDTVVFKDMERLMDYSFSAVKTTLIEKGSVVKTLQVPYKVIPFIGPEKIAEVPLNINEEVKYYKNDIEPEISAVAEKMDLWNLDNNKAVGSVTVSQRDNTNTYSLYTTFSKGDIFKANLPIYIGVGIGLLFIIILLIILILKIIGGGRRNRYPYSGRRRY